MHRPIVLAFATFALAIPASGSAQTTTSERERDRIEREREKAQEARDRAREREQEKREREQEKVERDREREQERRERDSAGSLDTTVAFDAKGTVTVICPQGAVIVTGSDKSEIRVRARTENGAIRFISNGSRATLEPASGRGCNDGRFEITVPTGAKISARSWSGSVSVRGVHGDVDTQTQSADIEVRDVGRLELETLSGDVTINGVKGDANINTVSGDVELTGLRGDLEAETVSGDLRLSDIVAKQVRTHTTSGDVDFAGAIVDGGRYEFNTHSGEIGLELPRDVGAQLSVSTFNGEIDSEFPITLKSGTDHGIGSAQAKKLTFTLGQGNARIVAETFSGNITIRSTSRRR
jgi:DUF4097 and DUF4098 domain-containing protein YvlB